MAARANWKGYLRLSLVSCPIALYPATTESEKVRFHQINKNTGNRIRYMKVDADTGEEVDSDNIVKGYEVSKGNYIEITDEDLEAVAVESTRTIEIDQFVPRDEIDDLYNIRPYFIAPDGNGADAFVTIREAIAATDKVAIGRLVLTTREHVIALEPRGKGLMGTLLRYPYEVREEDAYFEDVPDIKVEKEMLELAKHIVKTKSGHFDPDKFEDHYEKALRDIIKRKAAGEEIKAPKEAPRESNVINLMDALKRSLAGERDEKAPARSRSSNKASKAGKASKAKKRAASKSPKKARKAA
jgi:DNA end-binding protein Ku